MSGAESLFDDWIGEGEDSTANRSTKKVQFKDGIDDSLANMVVDSSSIQLAIVFSDRITKILIKGMELTMVVKLHGRNISYGDLYNRITSLWKPTKSFRPMDVANRYYLIRFQSRVDYDLALTQGPWIILDPLSGSAGIPVPEKDLKGDWNFGWRSD
ncbi:hypothetical protein Gotur_028145 [Gossypium turneri]